MKHLEIKYLLFKREESAIKRRPMVKPFVTGNNQPPFNENTHFFILRVV